MKKEPVWLRLTRNILLGPEVYPGLGPCWLWQGSAKAGSGYGIIRWSGEALRPHIASYKLFYGSTNGQCVLHSCDVRQCVNPAHLRLGTRAENNKDASIRRRYPNRKGTANVNAKLNIRLVKEIRLAASEGIKATELRNKYKVSDATIRGIIDRTRWAHVA